MPSSGSWTVEYRIVSGPSRHRARVAGRSPHGCLFHGPSERSRGLMGEPLWGLSGASWSFLGAWGPLGAFWGLLWGLEDEGS
eukprot:4214512-Pyramimonas_sp.AAC.1